MPYCQFCGTKLEEGQACTCEMSQAATQHGVQQSAAEQAAQQPAPQQSAAKSQASSFLKDLKTYLTSYVIDPEKAVRSVVDANDLSLPVALTVIRLLAMGLAIYGLLRKICDSAFSYITNTLMRYESASDVMTADLSVSLPKCLLYGALIALAGMALFILMAFILVKLRHGSATFAGVFKASAANGILTTALLLLSFLFSFFSVKFCFVFMALAVLSWFICGALTLRVVSPNNGAGMLWLLYFVGVALVIVAGYYVLPKLFLQAVGGISASYMGKTLSMQNLFDLASRNISNSLAELDVDGIEEYIALSFKDLFNGLISEVWNGIMY